VNAIAAAASNRTKPKGRRTGGSNAALSTGNARYQSLGQDGRSFRLRARKTLTPKSVIQDGRAIQRAAEVLGFTTRRKPSAGMRLAATMSGVVWPFAMAKR
jgi:hypothetical protein